MVVKNIITGFLVIVAVSFAQSADSTEKTVNTQQVTVSTTVSDKSAPTKRLGKQQVVKKNTTWSKIKDLFM